MLYVLRTVIRKTPGKVIKKVPLPEPEVVNNFGCRNQIGEFCKNKGINNVLLVTDKTIFSLGLHKKIISSLKENNINYAIFSDISSEPNLTIIDNGRKALNECKAEAIIALGGGAVMDSCKMIAAGGRLKNWKSKSLLLKFLYVKNKTLPLITIPTTAGTGAEITVGSIVTNSKGIKTATVIIGLNVIGVFLDGELMSGSPQNISCSCAIDALSHGLEGVVSSVNVNKEDMHKSMDCVKLVLENLPNIIKDSHNIEARQNMCLAAHYGGNAINKQLAGYVHAFAHSIGAKYHLPHGKVIAMCLLPVMNEQKSKCIINLAKLSRYCGYATNSDKNEIACDNLLNEIKKLLQICSFENTSNIILKEDYKKLATAIAIDSINYSSPIVLNNKQIYSILDEINRGIN